jgi:hypothetical protein
MPASRQLSTLEDAQSVTRAPERVYVRLERLGRHVLWGMENGGLRSEVVERLMSAGESPGDRTAAIERDLRRGVGL